MGSLHQNKVTIYTAIPTSFLTGQLQDAELFETASKLLNMILLFFQF